MLFIRRGSPLLGCSVPLQAWPSNKIVLYFQPWARKAVYPNALITVVCILDYVCILVLKVAYLFYFGGSRTYSKSVLFYEEGTSESLQINCFRMTQGGFPSKKKKSRQTFISTRIKITSKWTEPMSFYGQFFPQRQFYRDGILKKLWNYFCFLFCT